jgi:hypothetical protein
MLVSSGKDRDRQERIPGSVAGTGPALLVLGLACALFVFSAAGSLRGPTLPVRYLVLAVPAVAVCLGRLCVCTWRLNRPMAVAIAVIPLLHNIAGYRSLEALNVRQLARTREEERLLETLAASRVDAVVGSYWEVGFINFLAYGRVSAYSYDASIYLPIREDDVRATGARWALVGTSTSPIRAVAERVGLPGKWVSTGGFEVFVLEETGSLPSRDFLQSARVAAAALNAGP